MSVTLRDAQHLCWKNFRKINDKLDPEKGKSWTPIVTTKELLEEANRLASTVRDIEGSANQKGLETKQDLPTELSNMLYMIFVLAENYGIELEDGFLQTVNDYILRFIS